jgi:GR25 family glycosyltransferase involved in LPS biosynthesis
MDNVVYINLKYRTDRKIHVERQFLNLGIHATRVEALRTLDGAIGCTISHIKCIELAKQNNWPTVCICEDDVLFTNPEVFKTQLDRFLKSDINWDVLLLGANIAPPFDTHEFYLRVYNAQTTTAYIVKQSYYDTLLKNFKDGLELLKTRPYEKRYYAIDMYWKQLQQRDNWFILYPLTVVQMSTYSDIEERVVDYKKYMLDSKSNLKTS